jgi:ABC-type nitrate/sulfonate/bicarbonate transport system substrate-binding protein
VLIVKQNVNSKLMILVTVTLLAVLFVAGCSRNDHTEHQKSAAETAGKKYDVVRVPTSADVRQTIDQYVGDELGFFAEEGIKLEFVGPVPAPQLVAAVVAGKIDVGGAHVGRTIAGISAGAKIKAVSAHLETTKEVPHMVYVTRADSPIKTAQDLIGKKVGLATIGGCHEYTPYAYLLKNGIQDPKSKLQITVMSDSLLDQALLQGDIDVAGYHRSPDQIGKDFKVIFSDYDVWGTIGGGAPAYFSEKFIAEKPDLVRRYVNAIVKTHNWSNENPQKAAEITAKRGNVAAKSVRPVYYAPNSIIKEETVTLWIDLLKEFGEIKGDIRPDQIYTNEFNPTI